MSTAVFEVSSRAAVASDERAISRGQSSGVLTSARRVAGAPSLDARLTALWRDVELGLGASCIACGGTAGESAHGEAGEPHWRCHTCGSSIS